MSVSIVLRILSSASMLAAACLCTAQSYPSRPVRLVIPFPPGGGADITGRIVGQKLSERLGTQVVIDNRPGASTMIGTEIVARAGSDGYTLLMSTSNHSINPVTFARHPFDAIKDFTPIVLVNTTPLLWAVSAQGSIRNLTDLIAQAKASPGSVKYGTGGHGTHTHLVVEMLRVRAKVELLSVPYKSVQTTGVAETVAGQITMVSASVAAFLPYVKSGRLRGIAVTGATRTNALPDVPTVAEQGFPGYASEYWLGLMGPANVPAAIVNRINQETNAALKQSDVGDQFRTLGAEATGGTPAEFRDLVVREAKLWAEVVKAIGFQPQ